MKIKNLHHIACFLMFFAAIACSAASGQTALLIAKTVPPTAVTGAAYAYTMKAQGGSASYQWAIKKGRLPSGITLNSTTGKISGVPNEKIHSTLTISVKDSYNPVREAETTVALDVVKALAVSSTTLPDAEQSAIYSTVMSATGGSSSYVWSLKSGTVPDGLHFYNTYAAVVGLATTPGTYKFVVQVADANGVAPTISVPVTLTVIASLSVATASLPAANTVSKYATTLQSASGIAPYRWEIATGSLPPGLSLSPSTGVISGKATGPGAPFTVRVFDSTLAAALKILTIPVSSVTPLVIGSSSLPSGTAEIPYAVALNASGGTPAYTWSLASGAMPAGLTLAATTGIISGTPSSSGSFPVALVLTDNGNPAQTASVNLTLSLSAAQAVAGPKTWYVRPDGGTRYSANATRGQCDGLRDAPYGGVGVNQHCAFKDYRSLWDDQASYGVTKWVIDGGDTVIVRKNMVNGVEAGWRVGFDTGDSTSSPWCIGGNGRQSCTNPTIPAGTAAQHTRILGENFAACSAKSAMTEIHGGFGLGTALNLTGAQYVDVQCLNITDHSNCVVHGSPALPRACQTQVSPIDDYDSDGIATDVSTHDLLLQDIWTHGHTDRGVIGPIGGLVTADNIDVDKNGEAGWDFDDGRETASVDGTFVLKNSVIEWNGCNEEYPIVDAIPVESCYSQSTGGYGDGIGTPAGMGMNVVIDRSIFRYNTQDGEDFGHIDTGLSTISITNSQAYGNLGQQFKWGPAFSSITFVNNFAEANCARMEAAFPGAPSSYNANVSDFCRAGDALSFNFVQGSQALFAHNTIITYAPTTFDMKCEDPVSCSNTVFTLSDNIVLGYTGTYYDYGQKGGPAGYCGANCNDSTLLIGTINRSNNVYYGLRSCPAGVAIGTSNGTINGETCADPQFVNEPVGFHGESSLDNFNFALSANSPMRQAGVPLAGQTKDYLGALWQIQPSIGALEYNPATNSVLAPTR